MKKEDIKESTKRGLKYAKAIRIMGSKGYKAPKSKALLKMCK